MPWSYMRGKKDKKLQWVVSLCVFCVLCSLSASVLWPPWSIDLFGSLRYEKYYLMYSHISVRSLVLGWAVLGFSLQFQNRYLSNVLWGKLETSLLIRKLKAFLSTCKNIKLAVLLLKARDTSMLVLNNSAQGKNIRLINTLFKTDLTPQGTGLKLKIFSDLNTHYTGDKVIMNSSYER